MSAAGRVWRPDQLPDYAEALLLDTHIWVWYLEGEAGRMMPDTLPLLDRSGANEGLLISDISYWEVAVKSAKGKLTFSVDAAIWLRRSESAPGTRLLALDRDILLLSARLPGTAHSDPADRMLIATAQLNGLPLVTVDPLIIDYASAHAGTPVVDARP